jgi:PAS domain S-box-containing protein
VRRDAFSSGAPLFTFDEELRVTSWNNAAEELTGITAEEAIGQRCWQVLGGHDDGGGVACHAGCANARLMREGYPVRTRNLEIKTGEGRRRVSVGTIAVRTGSAPSFVHVLGPPQDPQVAPLEASGRLTPRQRDVLELLAEGSSVRAIAGRLDLAESTVRNHVRAILVELDAHSQLEAVARARRFGLL